MDTGMHDDDEFIAKHDLSVHQFYETYLQEH